MLIAHIKAHSGQELVFKLRRNRCDAGSNTIQEVADHRMRLQVVEVAFLFVEFAQRQHVLVLPSRIALHDVLIAHVEAHGGQELVFKLRRNRCVAFSNISQEPAKHRMRSRDVEVAFLFVEFAQRQHVLVLPLRIALHDVLIAHIKAHGGQELVFKLRRNRCVAFSNTSHEPAKHRMRMRDVEDRLYLCRMSERPACIRWRSVRASSSLVLRARR